MSFTRRLDPPSVSDPLWIMWEGGGYNGCIAGTYDSNVGRGGYPSVLANCTGYVHGRWMEIGNTTTEYDLSYGNAGTYYGHNDAYDRGSTPRLGAILCFAGNPGHVCIVEWISDDATEIITSDSNYGGNYWEQVYRYASNNWGVSGESWTSAQGFIYHPDVSPTPPTPPAPTGGNLKLLLFSKLIKKRREIHGRIKRHTDFV